MKKVEVKRTFFYGVPENNRYLYCFLAGFAFGFLLIGQLWLTIVLALLLFFQVWIDKKIHQQKKIAGQK